MIIISVRKYFMINFKKLRKILNISDLKIGLFQVSSIDNYVW